MEYLNKFIIAYDYANKKAIVDNSEGELNRMKQQQEHEEQTISGVIFSINRSTGYNTASERDGEDQIRATSRHIV